MASDAVGAGLIVVHDKARPIGCAVARDTVIGRGHVLWGFSWNGLSIVTIDAGRCRGAMVKANCRPGRCQVARFADCKRGQVFSAHPPGVLAVMAGHAIARNLAVVIGDGFPAFRRMALGAVVGSGRMRLCLSLGKHPVVATHAG